VRVIELYGSREQITAAVEAAGGQAAERHVSETAAFAPHSDLGTAPRVDDEAAGPLLFDGEGDTGHADSVMASGAAAKRIRKSLICKVCETPQNTVFLVSRRILEPNKINNIG
tara:strand:- start:2019 stop:2357 length:339 start_codon:yes stop_codon:yes gene_type:complete